MYHSYFIVWGIVSVVERHSILVDSAGVSHNLQYKYVLGIYNLLSLNNMKAGG